MTDHWSSLEVELIVSDYFAMLIKEMVGQELNKTQHRNALRLLLRNRSAASIEFKHQNISAILISLGLPFIKGYKPKNNYQQILEQAVVDYLASTKLQLKPKFERFADTDVSTSKISDFSSLLDSPPELNTLSPASETNYPQKPFKINYLEREQKNSDLGSKGEYLVMEYEKWRLVNDGKESFAEKVEWIAKYDDTAGFDILSRNKNGTDRFIEVKTTKLTKYAPIFFTRNEYEFSKRNKKNFYLYRLFNFNETPKLFQLTGSFDDFCQIEPLVYSGRF